MGRVKEPLEVDFEVDPRPLTKDEQFAISEFIKMDKEKRALMEIRPVKIKNSSRRKTTV